MEVRGKVDGTFMHVESGTSEFGLLIQAIHDLWAMENSLMRLQLKPNALSVSGAARADNLPFAYSVLHPHIASYRNRYLYI